MRQEIVTYKVYKFEELSEKVQQKVLENLWDINVFGDWHDPILECYKERLNEVGFEDAEIHYSGFWSQGDGASFDASINLEKIVQYLGDKRFNKLIHPIQEGYISASIGKNSYASHYSHRKTRYVDIDLDFNTEKYRRIQNLCMLLEEYVENLRMTLCSEIYETLEKEYDYLTSKEAILDCINANEYDFLEDGKIF